MQKSGKKKWTGWFRPLRRPQSIGPLLVAAAEIIPERQALKSLNIPLVISVPRSCGNAVRRNRFKRMVKAYAKDQLKTQNAKEAPSKNILWIRLLNKHRLDRKIRLPEWEFSLEAAMRSKLP